MTEVGDGRLIALYYLAAATMFLGALVLLRRSGLPDGLPRHIAGGGLVLLAICELAQASIAAEAWPLGADASIRVMVWIKPTLTFGLLLVVSGIGIAAVRKRRGADALVLPGANR